MPIRDIELTIAIMVRHSLVVIALLFVYYCQGCLDISCRAQLLKESKINVLLLRRNALFDNCAHCGKDKALTWILSEKCGVSVEKTRRNETDGETNRKRHINKILYAVFITTL